MIEDINGDRWKRKSPSTVPDVHEVPLKNGASWFAVIGQKEQRCVEYVERSIKPSTRRAEFRRWPAARNVKQKGQKYPQEPKRTGLAMRWVRFLRLGLRRRIRCVAHFHRIAALAIAGKESVA
jgi:hypothetical protein